MRDMDQLIAKSLETLHSETLSLLAADCARTGNLNLLMLVTAEVSRRNVSALRLCAPLEDGWQDLEIPS